MTPFQRMERLELRLLLLERRVDCLRRQIDDDLAPFDAFELWEKALEELQACRAELNQLRTISAFH